jgi:hypothetical protein
MGSEDMRKLRIYLDTSVISFLFADDAPEKMKLTRIDKTLKEVWRMKRAAHETAKGLRGDAYFEHVHAVVARAFPQLVTRAKAGYDGVERGAHARRSKIAAEPAAEYRVKRQVKRRKGDSRP